MRFHVGLNLINLYTLEWNTFPLLSQGTMVGVLDMFQSSKFLQTLDFVTSLLMKRKNSLLVAIISNWGLHASFIPEVWHIFRQDEESYEAVIFYFMCFFYICPYYIRSTNIYYSFPYRVYMPKRKALVVSVF